MGARPAAYPAPRAVRRFTPYAGAVGAAVAVVAGALLGAGPAAAASAGRTPKWSAPGLVDRVAPTRDGFDLPAISCPSRRLCFAVDASGEVLNTTNPAGGRGAWVKVRLSWRPLESIDCPSIDLCVAGDASGGLWVSTNPTGTSGAWHRFKVGSHLDHIDGVSCPSTRLCVAVDTEGDVYSSTAPAGGATAWRRQQVDTVNGTGSLNAVSCPTAHFCAAIDDFGSLVFTTTDPRGGQSAWHRRALERGPTINALDGVSCPSRSLCVVLDWGGNVLFSTTPLKGAWQQRAIAPGEFIASGGVECHSAHLCVAFYDDYHDRKSQGTFYATTDPTGAASAWDQTAVVKGTQPIAASCPARNLCVASSGVSSLGGGYDLTTSTPLRGQWKRTRIDGYNAFTGVSCPGTGACVAVDDAGNVLFSAHPAARARAWHAAHVDPAARDIVAISCPSAGLCVAIDNRGGVLTSTDPSGGASAWKRAVVDTQGAPTSVDCPSPGLCAFVDDHGLLFTTTDPSGGAGAWTSTPIDVDTTSPDDLTAVACASTKLCVVGDGSGDVLSSTDPTGGAAAWQEVNIEDPGANAAFGITGASCPSSKLCVLVDGSGSIITSTNPSGGKSTWTFQVNGPGHDSAMGGVACSSASLCFAIPSSLIAPLVVGVFTSTDPTGGQAAWRGTPIDPSIGTVSGLSCRRHTTACVAVDDTGNVIVSN